MTDRWAVALAVAVVLGARAAGGVPLAFGLVAAVAAFRMHRPALLCLGAALLASTMGFRAWAGLQPPATEPVAGVATLVTDPAHRWGAVRADARFGDRRVELAASQPNAAALGQLLAGERIRVTGILRPLDERERRRAAPRHVAARLIVRDLEPHGDAGLLSRAANHVRRTLARGARVLSDDHATLFTGFVIGDDRGQSEETRDAFRAAGLSHLLAVSGQNVAFVLAVVAPAVAGLGLRTRLAANLAVLLAFGILTRWEPSVLRAEGMAAIALLAFTLGRPVATMRALALTVAGLVLVDPLLVHSLGFALSVGASVGIALFAHPLARRIPGPRAVADTLGVTVAAQVGVAPVLVPVFGGMPLVAVPANLLAAPLAGPVMTWGLTAGLVAGLADADVAAILHTPTGLVVGWIAWVARTAAGL